MLFFKAKGGISIFLLAVLLSPAAAVLAGDEDDTTAVDNLPTVATSAPEAVRHKRQEDPGPEGAPTPEAIPVPTTTAAGSAGVITELSTPPTDLATEGGEVQEISPVATDENTAEGESRPTPPAEISAVCHTVDEIKEKQCTTLEASVEVTGDQDVPNLGIVETIIGRVVIDQATKVTNLAFLEKVREINNPTAESALVITGNPALEHLDLPDGLMVNSTGSIVLTITGNKKKLTAEESTALRQKMNIPVGGATFDSDVGGKKSGSSLPIGMIVAVVAVVAIGGCVGFCVYWFVIRKKKMAAATGKKDSETGAESKTGSKVDSASKEVGSKTSEPQKEAAEGAAASALAIPQEAQL